MRINVDLIRVFGWYELLFLVVCGSCARPIGISVPNVAATDRSWRLEVRCAYQGCAYKTDVLVGEDIEIEVVPYNERFGPGVVPFLVSIRFTILETASYIFDPSKSFITSQAGKKIYSKGSQDFIFQYSPPKSNYSMEYLKSPVSLSSQKISRTPTLGQIGLFFDLPAPSVDEKFDLTLDGLFREDGTPIKIPTLSFSKGER